MKYEQDFYVEDYKTLLREIREDLNKWGIETYTIIMDDDSKELNM